MYSLHKKQIKEISSFNSLRISYTPPSGEGFSHCYLLSVAYSLYCLRLFVLSTHICWMGSTVYGCIWEVSIKSKEQEKEVKSYDYCLLMLMSCWPIKTEWVAEGGLKDTGACFREWYIRYIRSFWNWKSRKHFPVSQNKNINLNMCPIWPQVILFYNV